MLIADAPAVLLMHLMHAHIVAFGRRVQLDRHIDETERDRPGPNGSHPPIETQPGVLTSPRALGTEAPVRHRVACGGQEGFWDRSAPASVTGPGGRRNVDSKRRQVMDAETEKPTVKTFQDDIGVLNALNRLSSKGVPKESLHLFAHDEQRTDCLVGEGVGT